jgi:hypothetical protein
MKQQAASRKATFEEDNDVVVEIKMPAPYFNSCL